MKLFLYKKKGCIKIFQNEIISVVEFFAEKIETLTIISRHNTLKSNLNFVVCAG